MEQLVTNRLQDSENLFSAINISAANILSLERALKYFVEELKKRFDIIFEIDNENRKIIEALCLYHTNHPAFELINPQWSLQKGILLFGPVGTGKTTIMHLFRDTPKAYTEIFSCRGISDKYSKGGLDTIEEFDHVKLINSERSAFRHYKAGYCFDDLGTESVSNYFGSCRNVMADIILNRYDYRLPFAATHVTTNISSNQIEDLYGLRVRDRMREMFNLMTLEGKSRRK